MYSMGILSIILFALVALTNASECRPVTCKLYCQYGFVVDAQGCQICKCRRSSNICVRPILNYDCGSIVHDCPSSHECQFDLSGPTGRCCLKHTGSSTTSPQSTNRLGVTGTNTTRPTTTRTRPTTTKTRPTTTTKPRTTTRHAFTGMFSTTTDSVKSSSTASRWFRSIFS